MITNLLQRPKNFFTHKPSVKIALSCKDMFVAHWRYLQLKNSNFFLIWKELTDAILNYPNFKELFPCVQKTSGHNEIKIHRILHVRERFVGRAFFDLILAFYPRELMWGLECPKNKPGARTTMDS